MDPTVLSKSSVPLDCSSNKPYFDPSFTSTSQYKGLNIQNINTFSQCGRISPYVSDLQDTTAPRSFTSAPVTQNLNSFPFFPDSDLNTNWSYPTPGDEPVGLSSLLTPESLHSFSDCQSQLTDANMIRSNTFPATMSSVGVPTYDAQFDNFNAWTQFELQDQLFSPLQSPGGMYEEPDLLTSTAYSRSPSSSPPQLRLSAEQRELKRRQDQARRESKTSLRQARSTSRNSSHYSLSHRTSPDLLPKSEYANVSPSPLLSQCSIQNSPALSSTPYLSSYSPQLNSQIPTDIYGQPFTINPSNFTSATSFPMPYNTTQSEAAIPAYLERSHTLPLTPIPDHLGVYCPQPTASAVGPPEPSEPVRVVHSRPKPQCWEHGCNGRQFSTFSNLLRHQREKSGAAQKSSCPHCGAEFTRTTARNGHLAHDKCKQRKSS